MRVLYLSLCNGSCEAHVCTWMSSVDFLQRRTPAEEGEKLRFLQFNFYRTVPLQGLSIDNSAASQKWDSIFSSTFLPLRLLFFFTSLLAAAVRPTFSRGDDEGRTTATSGRMKSQARGGETKINRSSQTKGHLLASNDNLSSWHKGEDGDKSLSVFRRQRQPPDTGDDLSLAASGL